MKPAINEYYIEVIEDMIKIIKNGEAGRRAWSRCEVTGRCDYGQTTRSTFIHWCKFFYVKTPKKKRLDYIISGRKPFIDGYYNGNTTTLIGILELYKKGYVSKSERVAEAFGVCVDGFMEDVRDWEYENGETYYKKENEK